MSTSVPSQPIGYLTAGLIALALVVTTAAAWQAMSLRNSSIVDEEGHHKQVELFRQGRWELHRNAADGYPVNAMLPGYHLFAGLTAWVAGFESRPALRLLNFALSAALVVVVVFIGRRLYPGDPTTIFSRTIQAYFLPVLFPFHYLVYTDELSALLCTIALLLTLQDFPARAGLASLAAAVVRQTNGLFALFLFAMGVSHSRRASDDPRLVWPRWQAAAWRWAPVLLGPIPLLAVVCVLGRVGIDAPTKHPFRIGIRNIELSLLAAGAVYAPWLLWAVSRLRWCDWKVVSACAGTAAVVALTPAEWHEWNDPVAYPYLLRNRIIAALYGSPERFVCRWLTCSGVLAGMASGGLISARFAWLYALWLTLLLPQWNVDPRYYISPLLCFTLMRVRASAAVELVSAAWTIALGGLAFWSIWWFRGLI